MSFLFDCRYVTSGSLQRNLGLLRKPFRLGNFLYHQYVPDILPVTGKNVVRFSGWLCVRQGETLTLLGTSATLFLHRWVLMSFSTFLVAYNWLPITLYPQGSEVSGKRKGQVNKDLEKCIELLRKILLYQYKISPNARQYLKEESCVRVDPFDRMMQFGSPDCIDAVCNIYEMFRAIVSSLGEGILHPSYSKLMFHCQWYCHAQWLFEEWCSCASSIEFCWWMISYLF